MFERFGEFDSAEELNRAAKGLFEEGDFDSMKELGKENGLEPDDVEDYYDGVTKELATIYTAAFGRVKVDEAETIKGKSAVEKMPYEVISQMIKGMCTEESFARAVMQKGKRMKTIFDKMRDEAGKHKSGNMGISCGTDRQLCEIIRSYYTGQSGELEKRIQALYR